MRFGLLLRASFFALAKISVHFVWALISVSATIFFEIVIYVTSFSKRKSYFDSIEVSQSVFFSIYFA